MAPTPKKKRRRNKRRSKKKKGLVQETNDSNPKGVGVIGPTTKGYVGANHPSHILFVDYYGNVRSRFVGDYEDNVLWTIWVPNPLVTNMIGPIEKLGPKSKK